MAFRVVAARARETREDAETVRICESGIDQSQYTVDKSRSHGSLALRVWPTIPRTRLEGTGSACAASNVTRSAASMHLFIVIDETARKV